MPTPHTPLRGVQDIRTHSGSVGSASNPSTAYLRIAVLEMEKERRGREKESALHRLQNIDTRFREIEAERAAIFESLGQLRGGRPPCAPEGPAPSRPNSSGLRIKY